MSSPNSDFPRRKRIAVIAVHGVADQQPEETANTAANLLLHMQSDGALARYHGFKTHRLRIAHRAVKLVNPAPNVPGDPSEKCQHQFLRGQLKNYEEPDPAATYQTIRNEGVRGGDAAGSEREVHIYEMYWADLSRVGNSFLTFFVELYQLLFHLCTVGAKTARFAKEQHRNIFVWQAFSWCIQWASHCIRLPIPIGNLFVLALIAFAASAQIPPISASMRMFIIAIFSISVGSVLAIGFRKFIGSSLWPYVLMIVAVVVALVWVGLLHRLSPAATLWLLQAEIWFVLLALLWKILASYEKRHPHAKLWGVIIGAFTTVLLLCALSQNSDVIVACETAGNSLLFYVGLTWAVVILTAFLGCLFGGFALRRSDPKSLPTDQRAIFTANLVTAVTGFLMLVINIALWSFLPKALQFAFGSSKYTAFCTIAEEIDRHLAAKTIVPGMATLLMLWALAALWTIWSLVPTVRSEVDTPKPELDSARWIGRSLTTAFRAMTWSGYLAIGCFSFLLPFAILLPRDNNPIPYLITWDLPKAVAIFGSFAWLILLFITAPFFLKGAVVKLTAGFRQALDVALDVINYLREHPTDSTIRAQIFARYASLLRYVCSWKSPIDGAGYDRIVIFAHSQGSIITVDLLRFLKVEPDPELQFLATPDRIQLFTMGCPLRQLYGLRFPHIYDWARHPGERRPKPPVAQGDTGPNPALPTDDAPLDRTLPEKQRPDPTRLLSVSQWVNAYRSGDYVGRNLWRSEKDDDVYALGDVSEDATGMRREFCIGGGAHIHYWDKTAPTIVAELDRLIASDPRDKEPTADDGSTSR